MISYLFTNPIYFFSWFIALLIAISFHEAAHAWMADYLGDPTARLKGRLTLNPFVHLDGLGTFALVFFGFGWGKPVPVDIFNLRNPKKDYALISLSGPLTNLLLAILASFLIRTILFLHFPIPFFLWFLVRFVSFNIILAIFNLLPVHPLDGFNIVGGLLPEKHFSSWQELSRFGFIFLILLIFPFFGSEPLIGMIVSPIINFLTNLLLPFSQGGLI